MTRLLLSLLIAGAIARADFDPARWQFRRGITITKPAPLVSLIVDRMLYHGSHDELGDLRIVHDQVETPYVIREIDARDDSAVSPAITHEPGARTTIVTTDIGFRGLPHDRIQLVVDPGQFYRSVTVESSRDSRKWKSIGAAVIFRMEDMGAYTVSFPEQWDQYLRIRILNRDNPPLAIRQLILSAKRRVVEFPAESTGKYWLYYGFPGARRPSYDFAQTRPLRAQPVMVGLGVEENNPAYREAQKPWSDRHPEALYAVLAAAILVMGFSALRFLRLLTRVAHDGDAEP